MLVKLDLEYITGGCPAGGGAAYVALYVDGVPLPGSRFAVSSDEVPRYLAGTIAVSSAGSHRASLGYDCPSTSAGCSGYGLRYYTWSLVLGQ